MLRVFRDAGLSPEEAAELLHILSACVVGFGFATLWGRQAGAAQEAAAAAGQPAGTGAGRRRPRGLRRRRSGAGTRRSSPPPSTSCSTPTATTPPSLPDRDQRYAELVLELLDPFDLFGVDRRCVHRVARERQDRACPYPCRASRSRRSGPGRAWSRGCTTWLAPWCAGGPWMMTSPGGRAASADPRSATARMETRQRGGGGTRRVNPPPRVRRDASEVSVQAGTGAGAGQQRPYSAISAQVTPARDGMSREISSSHTALG